MTIWGLIQVVINIFLFVGLFVCIVRSPRRSQDDPRLSRGLQLLQSKISVLEDLSDKTDLQFQKMTSLIEQKVHELQKLVANAEQQMRNLQEATEKGIETTRLVQTGMGAEQVIERQTSEVYAQAAQLAFEGHSIDEICEQLELSRSEVELIVKFNRDSLRTVSPSHQATLAKTQSASQDLSSLFEVPQFDASSLNKLGEAFRRVTREAEEEQKNREAAEQARYLGFNPQLEKADFTNEPPVLIPPGFNENSTAKSFSPAANETESYSHQLTTRAQVAESAPIHHQPAIEAQTSAPSLTARKTTVTVGGKPRELNSSPVVRKVVFPRIDG